MSGQDEERDIDYDWNWDAGIPHYPSPHYQNDEIDFFPRIIGGSPALLGTLILLNV